MPFFTMTTSARATISETWRVEAENEHAARERFESHDFTPTIEGGEAGLIFCSDSIAGDEEDREIINIEPDDGAEANGAAKAGRANYHASALHGALIEAEAFIAGFEDDEAQEGIGGDLGLLARIRRLLATIEEG